MAVYTQSELDAMKEEFLNIARTNIHREGLENLLTWLCNSDFFTAPASAFHHNSFEGGLLEHCLNVYKAAVKLKDVTNILARPEKLTTIPMTDESITICALFHDLCKVKFYQPTVKFYKEGTNWVRYGSYEINDQFPLGHGEKSVIILQQFIRLQPDEMCAIRWHMSWTDPGNFLSPYEKPAFMKAQNDIPLVMLLMQADAMATFMMEREFDQKTQNRLD